jgi:hypothetical protein
MHRGEIQNGKGVYNQKSIFYFKRIILGNTIQVKKVFFILRRERRSLAKSESLIFPSARSCMIASLFWSIFVASVLFI